MDRVLIPVGTGLALRNVLRTDLPSALAERGLSPVFAVPPGLHAQLASDPSRVPGDIVALPPISPPRAETILRDLEFATVQRRCRIETIDILLRERARHRPRRPWKERLAPLLGGSRFAYRALRALRLRLYRAQELAPLLRAFEPAVVFANNVFHPEESAVLRCARHMGLPTVAMVHSWDNPSTKGGLPMTPDRLLVWSDVMAREMEAYFGLPDDLMTRVGSPQFDVYAHGPSTTREQLLAHYGFAADTRLIVYATAAPGHCPWEPHYPALLADLIGRTRDRGPLGLVVRLHPRDHMHRYEALQGIAHVRLETAGRRNEGIDDRFNPTDADHAHFAALMRYAGVVVNIASTVALDAAANDAPGVHVGFDIEEGADYLDSVARFFDYTHTKRLIAYDAAPVARSADALCAAVLDALDDPSARAGARLRLARQEGVDGRGQSAHAIADALARTIHDDSRT